VTLEEKSGQLTLKDLYQKGKAALGSEGVCIEFSRDVIRSLRCPHCHSEEQVFAPVGAISYEQGKCPNDGKIREVNVVHNFTGIEPFGNLTLDRIGLPRFDIFTARTASSEIHYLIGGDAGEVLGPLVNDGTAIDGK
jgi:hypothetical protein